LRSGSGLQQLLAAGLLHGALSVLLATALHGGRPGAAALAGSAAVVAWLLCDGTPRAGWPALYAWPATAGLVTLLLQPLLVAPAPLSALAATVLGYTGCAIRRHCDPGGLWLLVGAALLASLPLWYGPWAELLAARSWLVDGPLALSPLGYLASMAGSDLLRGDWLYRHAAYGLLRYDYPGALTATLGWLAVGMLCQRRRPQPRSATDPQEEITR
jgi:hypothetical protein